jgi:uncharacterized membrane-anchored protein
VVLILIIVVRLVVAGFSLFGLLVFGSLSYERGVRAWFYAGLAAVCFVMFWLALLLPG